MESCLILDMAQLVTCLTTRSRGHMFKSQLSHITFVEIDQEIISTVIPPLLLIQERQLSVPAKVNSLVICLED